jgi:hypothetical protein
MAFEKSDSAPLSALRVKRDLCRISSRECDPSKNGSILLGVQIVRISSVCYSLAFEFALQLLQKTYLSNTARLLLLFPYRPLRAF